ncbi:TetR/AcrR family transcriptional regulator [Mesorhizobium sp. PAMC28654]|uniref:TetR/AcrR family transcriptional regulator n=1 Tax=Mesorhizobium sp. PAMC28654 TaxID=2880934 RepID=UPI001D0B1E64|nr:TetR/AcrR family transcriptional regulator [Mesorhizobium sp. PAMC28654]UDL90984.1 TetR/AcrR family transcriptional regulator [Mesorhizobium sp. PAMC28654]
MRERKKRATRVAIQRAALALFLAKGYDETTTEEIARAADVSPSTLFNYFPTKEALVADDYDPLFINLLETRPLDEPMFTSIRKALEAGLAQVVAEDHEFLLTRARLAFKVPALRAAAALDRERSELLLRAILTRRAGGAEGSFEIKVVSALVVSAMTTAMEAWFDADGKSELMELVGRALEITEFGAASVTPAKPSLGQ